jgi:hypothetical protein
VKEALVVTMLDYSIESARNAVRNAAPSGFYAEHSLLRNGTSGSSTSRWLAEGVDFVPTLCTTLHSQQIDNFCLDFTPPGTGDGPTWQTCPAVTQFAPYVIEIAVKARYLPTVGKQTWLAERLSLGLSQILESKIWPASAPTNTPWLGGGTSVTPVVAGAIGAVGAIEDKILAAAAGAGTLHMSASTAMLASSNGAIKDDGVGGFRTVSTGSKVIVGNYPPGKVAGHIGNIDVYIGPGIYQDNTFDRTDNSEYYHAWLEAAAAWHTCAAWVATIT